MEVFKQMPDEKIMLPRHIGVIMDGNGRWAKQRGLERFEGHKEGAKVFRTISRYAKDIGIEFITFYAFSTENWGRPDVEVNAIMDLFREYLHEADDRQDEIGNTRLRFIGEREGIPQDILTLMSKGENISKDHTKTTVNLAVNYGGRQEILHSVKQIAQKVKSGELAPEDITMADISANLYEPSQPDPDLIIRPSGEFRLSNFLLWQSAYTEFWYSDVLWPDFTTEDFDKAIADYTKRNRRFGGI